MKKAGVLGSGVVGQVLATGLIEAGYDVMIGTRDETKLAAWKEKTGGTVGSFAQAASHGEMVVLAVKGTAAESVIDLAGHSNLQRKVVIDTTNPIAAEPPVNGVLRYFTTLDSSLMEGLQARVPGARFVKAFSCVGNALMVKPDFGGEKPTMFICGNDAGAKREVLAVLDAFGWETEDLGSAEAARAIEPLCILWCIPGFLSNRWNHALRLLKQA